ncbi:hypothetical protein NYO67_12541 [Aspergillus flavus]|nr:hypothetical protein NYO67_12541 [Aspergillus flavus]
MTSRRIYHIQQVDPLYKFNIKFGGSSSLRWYSRKGYTLPIEALLKRGADLECTNERGWTPLTYAACLGHKDVVRLLLEKGADFDNDDHPYGRTPVIWAAMNGHEDVVGLLLEKVLVLILSIMNIIAHQLYGQPKKETRVSLGCYLQGRTPVLWAAKREHEDVVRLLLEKGADLETEEKFSYTPLAWAVLEGHEGLVRLLLEKGADLKHKSFDGSTPVVYAVTTGHEGILRLLLENGAELEHKDNEGCTAVMLAAKEGHEGIVRLLLEGGADLGHKDDEGSTVVMCTVLQGHEGAVHVIRLLLEGVLLYTDTVKLLLEYGADLECKNQHRETALARAQEKRHQEVVSLLLEHGAKQE